MLSSVTKIVKGTLEEAENIHKGFAGMDFESLSPPASSQAEGIIASQLSDFYGNLKARPKEFDWNSHDEHLIYHD